MSNLAPLLILSVFLFFALIMFVGSIPTKPATVITELNMVDNDQSKDAKTSFYFGLMDSIVHILQDTWNISTDELQDHCDYRVTSYGTVVVISLAHYQFRFYFNWRKESLDIGMIEDEPDSPLIIRKHFRNFSKKYEKIYILLNTLYNKYGSQYYLDKEIYFKSLDDLEEVVHKAASLVPDEQVKITYQAYKEDAAKYGITRKELSLLLMLSKAFHEVPTEEEKKEEVSE